MDVVPYAARVDKPGLIFMDTPGYDPPCTTGLIAGGANVLVFTTGRGSVLGLKPTPCIKVATNTPMYERMIDDMDLDAGPILEGEPVESVGRRLFELILEVAGGQPTRSERQGVGRGGVRAMVDRADPLSRTGPCDASRPRGERGPIVPRSGSAVLLAIACLELAWLGWFLVVPLPNVQVQNVIDPHGACCCSRRSPRSCPDTTFRQSMLGKGLSELSHVENLPQRLPIVLAAALIAAAAIGLGDAVRRPARASASRLRWPVRIALAYGLGAAVLGVLTLDRRPAGMARSLVCIRLGVWPAWPILVRCVRLGRARG